MKTDIYNPKEKDLTTLTSYLYLGYTNLIYEWLKYKRAKTKKDVIDLIRPIVINTIKDLNTNGDVLNKTLPKYLLANTTIRFLLDRFPKKIIRNR